MLVPCERADRTLCLSAGASEFGGDFAEKRHRSGCRVGRTESVPLYDVESALGYLGFVRITVSSVRSMWNIRLT